MRFKSAAALALAGVLASGTVLAKNYGPGASDKEVKLGQTVAYSGPASGYSGTGFILKGYFEMLNKTRGGINGRLINLLSEDDKYSPPETIKVTRRLVERDRVLAMVGSMGTAAQTAVSDYLNARKVPQLFMFASSLKMHDVEATPWTVPFALAYDIEGELIGRYIRQQHPDATIAVLYQNDDVGRSYLEGFRAALGDQASKIIASASHEISDPTVNSQVLSLSSSKADVFVSFASNKAQAQAIRQVHDIGWDVTYIVPYVSSSISGVLTPAGLEASKGLISLAWFKDPTNTDDPEVQQYLEFMREYAPRQNPGDTTSVYSYLVAQLAALTIERAGDELTRENILKQASSMHGVRLPMMLPGSEIKLTPTNHYPITQAQFLRFDGERWQPIGDLIDARPDITK